MSKIMKIVQDHECIFGKNKGIGVYISKCDSIYCAMYSGVYSSIYGSEFVP